ncbi:TetR/AcrR family transcriptional regulator [Micromonospora lupini]|uniref:TetR/AcrR family transcriptional regulator n=1 Tax=Micromonospora lupini TaxID=285679 RepID=UPI002250CB17|nr:TetR/AcrR family transcriptional regulator [Micromonospora lupini]MCX5068967.1 TetR/AcrR family transcriptional regulator [Micromonospora lupini]
MRSTAEARRATVLNAAVSAFARTGFHATPVTAVAAAAGISEAYVFRLFAGKLGLFVAAAGTCFERIVVALEAGAERAGDAGPEEVLEAMGDAYAELIADRDLLLFQVQAQAVTDVPEIAEAVRAGYKRVATFVRSRSGASDAQVQQFFAYGQLCHLIVTAGLEQVPEPWARALTAGIRHP